jgi:hypothetical protein
LKEICSAVFADIGERIWLLISEKREAPHGWHRLGPARWAPYGRGCRSLDVNRLHREGCLRPGWVGGWQWTRDGEKVASISFRAEEECLLLLYRYRSGGGDDWQEIEEPVSIDWTPCHFGGARPRAAGGSASSMALGATSFAVTAAGLLTRASKSSPMNGRFGGRTASARA